MISFNMVFAAEAFARVNNEIMVLKIFVNVFYGELVEM